jgi:membrane protein CcdC involved in cytochrome C biogenesis
LECRVRLAHEGREVEKPLSEELFIIFFHNCVQWRIIYLLQMRKLLHKLNN